MGAKETSYLLSVGLWRRPAVPARGAEERQAAHNDELFKLQDETEPEKVPDWEGAQGHSGGLQQQAAGRGPIAAG